ncbi:hypothetical protein GPECTOR_85g351 [Gonium pectorale]|uniref:MLO-like protein n=1 Tax=Gonium pectorale TaxID=33097 RepID=A0A150G1D3_GONPE|nr:hypothetical protein GPECTOR_85g351 [Gonium pectorale]|eukprot:KXZ43621.1 hypothetical protein GPECTOR_85g351 [Gonium pectorale]
MTPTSVGGWSEALDHATSVAVCEASDGGLADGLGAGVERAKSVIATAASTVADRIGKADVVKVSAVQQERVRRALEAHRGKGFENADAAQFFWFRNPKVIAYLFNWAYYENSLSIALLIFSLVLGYEDEWVFKGTPFWAVMLLLVADFVILVHSCLYVLPLYALITPVGSHCPKDVLRRAIKAGVFPRQTAVLAKAMHLQIKARATPRTSPLIQRAARRLEPIGAFVHAGHMQMHGPEGSTGGGAYATAAGGWYGAAGTAMPAQGRGLASSGQPGGAGGLVGGGSSRDLEAGGAGTPKAMWAMARPGDRRPPTAQLLSVDSNFPVGPLSSSAAAAAAAVAAASRVSPAAPDGSPLHPHPSGGPSMGALARLFRGGGAGGGGRSTSLRSDSRGSGAAGGATASTTITTTATTATTTTTSPPHHHDSLSTMSVSSASGHHATTRDEVVPFNCSVRSSTGEPVTLAAAIGGAGQAHAKPLHSAAARGPGGGPDGSSHHSAGSGGGAGNADSTGGLDMSFLRGAGPLVPQPSNLSVSSSLGRSGSITALMAGMYRGAVTHMSPEERRAASSAAPRVRGGRGLDFTLVPDK